MNNRRLFLQVFVVFGLMTVLMVNETQAGSHHSKKKKIVIHVPIHKKIEKHVHTIVKHVHHHHKPISHPIVLKEEKVIHEHINQEHKHEHKHEHPVHIHHEEKPEEEEEEEHIHHHHEYEHKYHEGDKDEDSY